MSQRVETAKIGRYVASAAIAPYLRVKHDSVAGEVAIAGDENWFGEAENRAYADQDPLTVYDKRAAGTHLFVASNAITAGNQVSTVAGGKVQDGTGGTITIGEALTTTAGDGEYVEVQIDDSYASFSGARTDLTQEDLVAYGIPLTSLKVHDAMITNLPGTAATDDMALITGTPGTAVPTLQGVDFGGTTTDEKGAFEFILPPEYVDGQTLTLRVRGAMLTTISDGTATVDAEVWKSDGDGAAGSDICATAAQSINSLTPANKDFTITPTGLVTGDRLLVRLAFIGSDTGDAGAMISEISEVKMLLDIKG